MLRGARPTGISSVGIIGPPPGLLTPAIVLATANETRLNTATITASSQLNYNIPIAGQYLFDVVVNLNQSAAGTAGANVNVFYSGTVTNSTVYVCYGSQLGNPLAKIAPAITTPMFSIAPAPASPVWEPVSFRGWMQLATTGTFSFCFAQNTASATITTTLIASASNPGIMVIRRIA